MPMARRQENPAGALRRKLQKEIRMTAAATAPNVYDAMKQVAENCVKTMQAGMKFYEDTAQICTEMATRNIDQAKDGFVKMATDLADLNKKHAERFQSFFDDQVRRGASLTPYMVDPVAFTNPAEVYDRMAAMWRNSFEGLRDCVTTSAKASAEAVEGWTRAYRTAT
jgi:hypothetical protein